MSPNDHAKISPSAIDGWIICGMYPWVQGDDDPGPYAKWGTAAHWLSETALTSEQDAADVAKTTATDPYGTEITTEMVDCSQAYIDYCRMKAKEFPKAEIGIEKRVSLEHWDLPEVYGTSDYIVDDAYNELTVIDLKAGRGISVPADSLQARLYARERL